VNVLKGGRRPRRSRSLANSLWFVAAGLAGVICAAVLVFKL
jgi:hypothetical protein